MSRNTSFYLRNKKTFLKSHRSIMDLGRGLMESRYGVEKAEDVIRRSEVRYEALLAEMPYIGGWGNPHTDTLTQVSSFLALYFVMKEEGKSTEEVGELVHRIADRKVETTPRFLRSLLGKLYMSKFWRRRTMKKALASQKKEHTGNFVYEVVEGKKDEYDWGINYLECAIVKFFHAQGADEFTPFMCYVDYILFPAMGIDLKRKGMIGQGCSHCDFRFRRGNPPIGSQSFG
ncbi:MAG: L-2-amino-thiazoline-4-carboxylic acid hydrolase [Chloroflexi bacterium]|nr:L-2-amino-thiazoline-4-carboxylic acid hydrolase [Chloroflexota bacterium]